MEGCKTADFFPTKPPGSLRDVARWVTGTLGGRDLQRAKLSVLQRLLDERTFASFWVAPVSGLLAEQGGGAQHPGAPCLAEPAAHPGSALSLRDSALSPAPLTLRLSGAPSGCTQHSRAGQGRARPASRLLRRPPPPLRTLNVGTFRR